MLTDSLKTVSDVVLDPVAVGVLRDTVMDSWPVAVRMLTSIEVEYVREGVASEKVADSDLAAGDAEHVVLGCDENVTPDALGDRDSDGLPVLTTSSSYEEVMRGVRDGERDPVLPNELVAVWEPAVAEGDMDALLALVKVAEASGVRLSVADSEGETNDNVTGKDAECETDGLVNDAEGDGVFDRDFCGVAEGVGVLLFPVRVSVTVGWAERDGDQDLCSVTLIERVSNLLTVLVWMLVERVTVELAVLVWEKSRVTLLPRVTEPADRDRVSESESRFDAVSVREIA
jgi:hypothetical protein